MLTGYLTTLPTDCLLSAGVLYCAKAGIVTPIGVTDGAPDFDPGVEAGEIMFDNRAPGRLKGLSRRIGFAPVFKGVLKEFGPSATGGQLQILEPEGPEATSSGVTTQTPKPTGNLFGAGAYLVDFRWVFERASGGYACIYAPLAIVRKWTQKGNDKKEAAISFEIEAIGDPVRDLSTAPYAIEIRTTLPASATDLPLTLDWAPLSTPSDLGDATVFVPSGPLRAASGGAAGDGYVEGLPFISESGIYQHLRATYPRAADKWGQRAAIAFSLSGNQIGNRKGANLLAQAGVGPFDNTRYDKITFTDDPNGFAGNWPEAATNASDHFDDATFRRTMVVWVAVDDPADVGKTVDVCRILNPDSYPAHTIETTQRVTLTVAYQPVAVHFDNETTGIANTIAAVRAPGPANNGAHIVRVAIANPYRYQSYAEEPTSSYHIPLLWHETLGALSQFFGQNCWGDDSDDPTLYGGATKSASVIVAPDDDNSTGGRTMNLYTVPNAGGFVGTAQPMVNHDDGAPARAQYLGIYIKPGVAGLPADGAFRGTLTTATGRVYGPVNLVKDETAYAIAAPRPNVVAAADGAQYYRARFQITEDITGGLSSGSNYIFTTARAHQYQVGDHITIERHTFVGNQSLTESVNGSKVVTAITATTFTIAFNTGGANGVGGTSLYTDSTTFTPKIQNDSGAQIQCYAYGLYANPESDRQAGQHQMWVRKRRTAASGNTQNGVGFNVLHRFDQLVTRRTLIFGTRQVWPFPIGAMATLGISNGADFVQSGPFGSADYTLVCGAGVRDVNGAYTNPYMRFAAERGDPVAQADWQRWSIEFDLPNDPTILPAFVAFDVFVAALNGVPIALGIGEGAGTSLTWIENGATWRGSTTVIYSSDTITQDWNLGDALIYPDGAHGGIAADRDRIRMSGGWIQALAFAGAGSINPATIRTSIQQHVTNRWGARQDYR